MIESHYILQEDGEYIGRADSRFLMKLLTEFDGRTDLRSLFHFDFKPSTARIPSVALNKFEMQAKREGACLD